MVKKQQYDKILVCMSIDVPGIDIINCLISILPKYIPGTRTVVKLVYLVAIIDEYKSVAPGCLYCYTE